MLNTRILKIVVLAACIGIVTPLFAESAPVFDADALQAEDDQTQDLPPPPPPESGFMPANQVEMGQPTMRLSTDQRMQRLEQQLSNLQSNDSVARVDSLQDQVRTLRNQIEELSHQLNQVKDQTRALATDMDKRFAQAAAAIPKPPPVTAAALPSRFDVSDVGTKIARKGAKAPVA